MFKLHTVLFKSGNLRFNIINDNLESSPTSW